MIDFCHIVPTAFLEKWSTGYKQQLLLAHLVEEDETYTEFYRQYNGTKILDNSAFEMYKQNREMYPSEKLLEGGWKLKSVKPDLTGGWKFSVRHLRVTPRVWQRRVPRLYKILLSVFQFSLRPKMLSYYEFRETVARRSSLPRRDLRLRGQEA